MSRSRQGACLACGAVGRGEDDHICGKCGDPKKTTLVCRGCKMRTDLTSVGPKMIKDFFSKIDPSINWAAVTKGDTSCGTTIVMPVCSSCRNKNKLSNGKTVVYKVRTGRR